MRQIELTAGTEYSVRIWLNGEEITNRAIRAVVPAAMGIEEYGTAVVYTEWPPILDEKTGCPKSEELNGIILWRLVASVNV